ncbi:MAG: guanylate kinase [Cyclobacteriaceae bacterium]
MNKGKAIIFCAPSGAGKTTIVKHLIEKIPSLEFSVSATTRQPREEVETDGKDYFFLTTEAFKQKVSDGEILEWQEVYEDIFYGTLRSEVDRIWQSGRHVIFDVDVVGGVNLKKVLGEQALAVFVNAESISVLENRLRARNTESEEKIGVRLAKAEKEMSYANQFDYELINKDLEVAFNEAEDLVKAFIK